MNSKVILASLVMGMLCAITLQAQEALPLHPGVGAEWYYDYAP